MPSSSESDVISKELQNLDLIYYNANLMTDVFKVIVNIVIWSENYCQVSSNIAICRLVGTELKKKRKKKSNSRFAIKVTERSNHSFLLYT